LSLIEYAVFHPVRVAIILVGGVALGLSGFYVYQVSSVLAAVAVEEFQPADAREDIEAAESPPGAGIPDLETDDPDFDIGYELPELEIPEVEVFDPRDTFPTAFGEPLADEMFETYLLVGSDASGALADAIILALDPAGSGSPIMVSLPRDLYVWNLCKGRFTRLNEGLGGCPGTASGSELLAIMVEDYTGVPVDHLARINFDGFARLIDVMGGLTVCVDGPTRDLKSHLDLSEPGCQVVDGATALAWVRSRHPERLVGEEWVAVAGSDFGRQKHQQDALFQLAAKAAKFSSPTTLASKLGAVASSVRLDSSWSFGQAVAAGWQYRGIGRDSVRRFSIEASGFKTATGAQVLIPDVTFTEQLATVADFG
jgi:LCP family protein required for cell wall assembly